MRSHDGLTLVSLHGPLEDRIHKLLFLLEQKDLLLQNGLESRIQDILDHLCLGDRNNGTVPRIPFNILFNDRVESSVPLNASFERGKFCLDGRHDNIGSRTKPGNWR